MEEFSREELGWTENPRFPEPEGALRSIPSHFVSKQAPLSQGCLFLSRWLVSPHKVSCRGGKFLQLSVQVLDNVFVNEFSQMETKSKPSPLLPHHFPQHSPSPRIQPFVLEGQHTGLAQVNICVLGPLAIFMSQECCFSAQFKPHNILKQAEPHFCTQRQIVALRPGGGAEVALWATVIPPLTCRLPRSLTSHFTLLPACPLLHLPSGICLEDRYIISHKTFAKFFLIKTLCLGEVGKIFFK